MIIKKVLESYRKSRGSGTCGGKKRRLQHFTIWRKQLEENGMENQQDF